MSKKTFEQKKMREKAVYAKKLRQRAAKAKEDKAERLKNLAERESQKIANRVEGRTIVNRSPEDQKALLERNLQILKALEEQKKLEESKVQHERARGIKQTAEVQFIPNPETNEPLKVPIKNDATEKLVEKLNSIKKTRKLNSN